VGLCSESRSHTDRPFLQTPYATATMSKVVFGQPTFSPPSASPHVHSPPRQSEMSRTTWARHVHSQITYTATLLTTACTGPTHRRFQICRSSRRLSVCARSVYLPSCPAVSHSPTSLVFDRETGKPKGYGFCEFAGIYPVPFSSYQSSHSLSDSLPPD